MSPNLIKSITWIMVIMFWLILTGVFYAIVDRTPLAVLSGVVGILSLFLLHAFLTWYYGISRFAAKHLGTPMSQATFVNKTISGIKIADYRGFLEHLHESDHDSTRFGGDFGSYGIDLSTLAQGEVQRTALQWTTRHTSDGEIEQFVTNAVYLLRIDDHPIVVAILAANDHYAEFTETDTIFNSESTVLQLFAESIDHARDALREIVNQAPQHSVYRGRLIQVSRESVRIAERPSVNHTRIILPEGVLDTVNRTISARYKHHKLLRQLGHSSKTGILLHGVPGTGKTLVAKHLVGICEDHTGIIPNDLDTETLRMCFQMASYLQPAIILIEDVDLLARRREENWNISGLHQLMNEMDGLAPTCETIVLLSTNRPEVVEPALINRPGRVSQAIEFPVPDAKLRNRLFHLYCPSLSESDVDLPKLIEKTDGCSPAFIEELCKRAILFAAERQGYSDDDESEMVNLSATDMDNAMHELLISGGNLTKGILGFDQSRTPEP